MSTAVRSWLFLALIFLAGGLSGAALSMVLAPRLDHRPVRVPRDPGHIQKDMMAGLTRELALTPDQQTKIEPIIGDATKQMHLVHQDEIKRISEIFKSVDDQMSPLLTPDQKTRLDKLEAQGSAGVFFGRQHGWGAPGGAPRPPPPPPPAPSTNAPPKV